MRALRCTTLFFLSLVAGGVIPAGLGLVADDGKLSPEERRLNLESFDYIWSTIRDKHWDPRLGGLDWEAVRLELRPEVEQAESTAKARSIMNDMVQSLGLSHLAVFPSRIYESMQPDAVSIPGGGTTGIDVRVVGGDALITSVAQGSPAEEAGVRPGWEILGIQGEDVPPRIEELSRQFQGTSWRDGVLTSFVLGRLGGAPGGSISLDLLNGDDERVTVEVGLVERRGWKVRVGYLPATRVWIDVELLQGDIGFIAFNSFLDPGHLMPAFNEGMESFLKAEGVIIDVRGNGGGLGAMAMGMAGWLVPQKNRSFGTLYLRGNELKVLSNPRATTYDGPVAILIDGLSASAAEFFAGGLQEIGRARVFGTPSAGAALASSIERLPNGDGFQYVVADYKSAAGASLEGVGVIPDVEVTPTRKELLQSRDPALEAAVSWIREQGRGPSPGRPESQCLDPSRR